MLSCPAAFLTLVLPSLLPPQQDPGLVFTAAEGRRCQVMPPNCRGVAVTRTQGVLVLVLDWPGPKSPSQTGAGRLLLCRSKDGGRSFGKALVIAQGVTGRASILARPDSEICDLVWDARGKQGGIEPWHQTYDAAQGSLVGKARCLLESPRRSQGSHVTDVCPLPDGGLALTLFANRSPVPPMTSAWDGALLLLDRQRRPGKSLRLNVGSSGIQASLQPDGSRLLRIGFRSHGRKGFGLYERRFDLQRQAYADPRPRVLVQAGILGKTRAEPGNLGCMARDGQGGFYLLCSYGHPSHLSRQPKGGLRLAYLAPPTQGKTAGWSHASVAEDRGPDGGNVNPIHFGLSRGPGNQVFVVYSLREEQHTRIYRRAFAEGRPFGKAVLLREHRAGSFRAVNTLRDHRLYSTLWAVASGSSGPAGRDRVRLLAGTWPLRNFWDKRRIKHPPGSKRSK